MIVPTKDDVRVTNATFFKRPDGTYTFREALRACHLPVVEVDFRKDGPFCERLIRVAGAIDCPRFALHGVDPDICGAAIIVGYDAQAGEYVDTLLTPEYLRRGISLKTEGVNT